MTAEDLRLITAPFFGKEVEAGEEVLLADSMVYRAHGDTGKRCRAVRVKVLETDIHLNESAHRIAEGIAHPEELK